MLEWGGGGGGGGGVKWLLQRRMQLSILPWQRSLFIYHYKKQSVKHMEKNTLLSFKYVVKYAIKRYYHTAVKLCKTFCFTWILKHKGAYIKSKLPTILAFKSWIQKKKIVLNGKPNICFNFNFSLN